MNGMPYSSVVSNAVERKLEKESLGLESYTEDFDAVSTSNAKLLLILIAIFMTPAFAILCRKDNYFFADHFTISLELSIYNIFVNTICIGLILYPVVFLFKVEGTDITPFLNNRLITAIVVISLIYFLFNNMRNMYRYKMPAALLRAVLLLVWIVISLIGYRFVLFWVTFYSV